MEIINGITDFYLTGPTAVAIGKFDGIHRGHRSLIVEILEQKKLGCQACVFTFSPAPSVFFGFSDGRELTTREEKIRIFEEMGVDILIEYPMNHETAAMLPEVYVEEVLVKRMKVQLVVAGHDVSFGAKGAGKKELLQSMGQAYGFEVRLMDKVCLEDREISSTYVREAVEQGDLSLVKKLLGTPYKISGTVVQGNRIGRTIGIPTVNLLPPEAKFLPPNGVYFSEVLAEGKKYKGMSNIGYKPTIEESKKCLGVETYIFDFSGDMYGKEITVLLHEFWRHELQFDSLEELKLQMEKDLDAGREYLGNL